jgi:hypothetical protein
MAKKRTIYRDTKSGRFASKKAWKQGKSRGSKRYKRERIKAPVKKRKFPPVPPPIPEGEVHEYVVSFSYDKSGRSFDVIVTATSQEEARSVARGFLSTDAKGRNIARAKFQGWRTSVAQGRLSGEDAGEAEYRSESEEE